MTDNRHPPCPAKMEDGARFLTDYRNSTVRDLHIMSINGINNASDYRAMLQQNGELFMDNDWNVVVKRSCFPTRCVHVYPTRTTLGSDYEEMQLYNAVKSNKITPSDENYPKCEQLPHYRMSTTKNTDY